MLTFERTYYVSISTNDIIWSYMLTNRATDEEVKAAVYDYILGLNDIEYAIAYDHMDEIVKQIKIELNIR